MNDKLNSICNTVAQDFTIASGIYKLDYAASAVAFGICLTDRVPLPDRIEQAKMIVKQNTKMFSTFAAGCPRMVSIAKMAKAEDAGASYNKMVSYNDVMRKVFTEDYFVALASILLTDFPHEIGSLAAKTAEIYKIMKKKHFLGVGSKDKMVITLMAASKKSVDDMMSEADVIYNAIKKGFTFAKDDAYTVAYLLASYEEATEWKIKTFIALMSDLKAAKIKFSGYYSTISILAPLTIAALTTDRSLLIKEILEADRFYSKVKGMGGLFGIAESIRRMLAAASVIKAYAENDDTPYSVAEYLTVMACQCEIKSEDDASTATMVTTM